MNLHQEIEILKNNEIIKDFVETEAYKQIAADIERLDPTRVCTEKAARLVTHSTGNEAIEKRWYEYVASGYLGVLMVKYNAKKL
jgi:hypothetical protein